MKLVLEDLTDAQVEAIRALIDKEKQKPVQKWEPKGGGWFIDLEDNDIYHYALPNESGRIAGLRYSTREQAQLALESLRAHARQLAWLAENGDGWVADWGSIDQSKYYVSYNFFDGTYVCNSVWSYKNINSIYMSEQNAEKLAKLLNDGVVEF